MMQSHTLDVQLERLLKFGTIVYSVVIAIGVVLNELGIDLGRLDFIVFGIVGFIALPIVRLLAMLGYYMKCNDIPIMRVVALVLTLVAVGVMLGIVW